MIRIIVGFLIQLLANALGLIVAAAILEDMTISGAAFVIAVIIFTVVYAIAQPFLTQMAVTKVPALRGGVALIATLVGLIITAWISDGLQIKGLSTWFLATLIVWVISLIGTLLLPVFLVKKGVEERRS
jgi:putative membrane protein